MYQNTWYILSTQQMMVIIVDIINILKPNMTKYQSLNNTQIYCGQRKLVFSHYRKRNYKSAKGKD